eukprot:370841_1
MQFRIRAVVMMMMGHVEMDGIDDISIDSTCRGIPLHSTPVSTVNSSILHPWGEKAKEDGAHGHGDGTSNDEGKEVDGDDDDGDDYILKEEDGGHGDGKSIHTRTGSSSIERMLPMVTSTHCCTWDRTVTVTTDNNSNSNSRTRKNQSGGGSGRGGDRDRAGSNSNSNIDRSNVLILPIRYKDIQRGTFLKLELITTPTGVSGNNNG